MALADENRKRIAGEIETLKAKADAEAQAAMSAAEARIAATRTAALGNVKAAAGEAAAAIVEKLIGEQVGADEAIKAVPTGGR